MFTRKSQLLKAAQKYIHDALKLGKFVLDQVGNAYTRQYLK